jgi:hypothetical protein
MVSATSITLCDQRSARDTMTDVPQTGIAVQHLRRGRLCIVRSPRKGQSGHCYTFEYPLHLKRGVVRTRPML